MPRPRGKLKNPFKGLNSVRRKRPDGKVDIHYYAYKGGPRLPDEYGSPEFIAAFVASNEERCQNRPANAVVLLSLLNDYQGSTDFKGKAERTRKDYVNQIKKIEKEFADFPLAAMTDKRTRGIFKDWRDMLASKSLRQADYAYSVLALVLAWGLDRGKIGANPCEKGGRVYAANRKEAVWTIDLELAYFKGVPPHLHLPFLLGIWTGQREGDLLRLHWSNYDGTHIRLEQHKSRRGAKAGKRVVVPVGKPLQAALDKLKNERNPGPFDLILLNSRGKAWTEHGFSTSFRKAVKKCGIEGLTFHDTRGTAVTRLALAGASVPQIATFTGHSLKDVESILEVHYLNRDPRLAEDALKKLELQAARLTGFPTEPIDTENLDDEA